jgi:hypothetical protein
MRPNHFFGDVMYTPQIRELAGEQSTALPINWIIRALEVGDTAVLSSEKGKPGECYETKNPNDTGIFADLYLQVVPVGENEAIKSVTGDKEHPVAWGKGGRNMNLDVVVIHYNLQDLKQFFPIESFEAKVL